MPRTGTGGTRTGKAFHAVAGPVASTTMSRPSQAEPPPPDLDIVKRAVNGHIVVTVTGEIDTATAPTLHTTVFTAIDGARGACVLDLSNVAFLDSAGLAALVAAHTHAEAQRTPLRIVVDSNRLVIRPIEITGLDVVLRLYHTVDEALTATERPDHAGPPPEARR